MAPNFYSFEKGINNDQDYDAALAFLWELRKADVRDEDKCLADGIMTLANMVEVYERTRYLIFYRGYTC
jgi:hypothetical protein